MINERTEPQPDDGAARRRGGAQEAERIAPEGGGVAREWQSGRRGGAGVHGA